MRSFAIILASGSGQRFGASHTPKHLTKINDVSSIVWTLSSIVKTGKFEKIIVIVRSQDESQTQKQINLYLAHHHAVLDLVTIEAGGQRIDTILFGIRYLEKQCKPAPDDVIAIFDSNRPLTPTDQLLKLHSYVSDHLCVCPARDVVNGVAKVRNGFIIEVPDKATFVEFVTPEFIKYQLLKRSLQNSEKKYACLVEFAISQGVHPFFVSSSSLNTKLTFPEDVAHLEGLIRKYNVETPQPIEAKSSEYRVEGARDAHPNRSNN